MCRSSDAKVRVADGLVLSETTRLTKDLIKSARQARAKAVKRPTGE